MKTNKKKWSRAEKLTTIGLMFAVGVPLLIPNVRIWLGLQKASPLSQPSPVSKTEPKQQPVQIGDESPKTVEQKASAKIKGHGNIAANNVSGDGNVVGSNNKVETHTAPEQHFTAPNGIVVAAGAVANNPTVNNFGDPPKPKRTIPATLRTSIVEQLAKHPAKIQISAVNGDQEATDFAFELAEIFKDAGSQNADHVPVRPVMLLTRWTGLMVKYKGETHNEGDRIEVPEGTSPSYILDALMAAKIPGLTVQTNPAQPDDLTTIVVAGYPKQN